MPDTLSDDEALIIGKLHLMTAARREKFFGKLWTLFCRHCGAADPDCQCLE